MNVSEAVDWRHRECASGCMFIGGFESSLVRLLQCNLPTGDSVILMPLLGSAACPHLPRLRISCVYASAPPLNDSRKEDFAAVRFNVSGSFSGSSHLVL